jgi:serine/threonine protein kinase
MPAGEDAKGARFHGERRGEEIVTFELIADDDAGSSAAGALSQRARKSQEIVTFEIIDEDDVAAGAGSERSPNNQNIVTFTLLEEDESAERARQANSESAYASIVVSLEEFARAVIELGLASAAELEALNVDPSAGVAGLSRRLINAGKLTNYQVAALCQNKSRSLLVGNYVILDELGKLGSGLVFKARHREAGFTGALNIFPFALANDRNELIRVHRQLQAIGQLNHPNLVAAFETDIEGSIPFVVMDYVAGRDLGQIVRERGPMQAAAAIELVIQAARGLAAAHAQGIFHHHINPSKLRLDKKTRTLRVTGMGLVRTNERISPLTCSTADRLPESATEMGRATFLAPEQVQGMQGVDHRADIYSLGCTLYFLLLGQEPFPEETALSAHALRPAPRLSAIWSDVPRELETAYLKMVAWRPEERPRSMMEMIALVEGAKTAIAASNVRGYEPEKSPQELRALSEKALKKARAGGRNPDPSVFAARPRHDGAWIDPDLALGDVVDGVRAETALKELPAALRPPIARRPLPARLEMTGSRRRSQYGGLVVIGLLAIAAVTAVLFPYHLFSDSGTGKNDASREGNKAAAGKDRTGNGVAAQPGAAGAAASQGAGGGSVRVSSAQGTPWEDLTPLDLGQRRPAGNAREREIAGWGRAIDPDGDCQIIGDRGGLTITVPPTLHDLNAGIRKYNAPRVMWDVEGDFEVEVRVDGDFTPGNRCNRPDGIPFVGAGFVIFDGADNLVRLERAVVNNEGSFSAFLLFEQHLFGTSVVDHNGRLAPGPTYLRLTRRGGTLRGYSSSDGQFWTELDPIQGIRSNKLQVGLDAVNSGNAQFTVRFAQLAFKK